MLAIYTGRGVAPEVNLREHISHTPPQSLNKAEPTLVSKPRGDVTRSPKQGYQWPHKWACVQQKFKKTRMHTGCVLAERWLYSGGDTPPQKLQTPPTPENFRPTPTPAPRKFQTPPENFRHPPKISDTPPENFRPPPASDQTAPPPWTEFLIHACENIKLAQTTFRPVTNLEVRWNSLDQSALVAQTCLRCKLHTFYFFVCQIWQYCTD